MGLPGKLCASMPDGYVMQPACFEVSRSRENVAQPECWHTILCTGEDEGVTFRNLILHYKPYCTGISESKLVTRTSANVSGFESVVSNVTSSAFVVNVFQEEGNKCFGEGEIRTCQII